MVKSYYRVMLGRKSKHAEACLSGGFIGTDFGIHQDLSGSLPEEWREFNRRFIPVFLEARPEKTKIAAGLACGAIWTVSKGIKQGDVVLSPDGTGRYRAGEVESEYYYQPGGVLPHRRRVQWFEQFVDRQDMSEVLRRSCSSIGTVSNISKHREEIESLLAGTPIPPPLGTDGAIEDAAAFVLEKHLEDFLVANWHHTELGRHYHIFEEEGEPVGQQYPTDTGPIDILAVSKDEQTLLVVELKKGRASDAVVGQTLRYMGYVRDELAEDDQAVRGAIIALEDDPRLRRALVMTPIIDFYRYEISFRLVKG